MFKSILNLPSTISSNLAQIWRELRKVQWLTAKETAQYTLAVFVIVILLALIILGMDTVLVSIRNFLVTV